MWQDILVPGQKWGRGGIMLTSGEWGVFFALRWQLLLVQQPSWHGLPRATPGALFVPPAPDMLLGTGLHSHGKACMFDPLFST